MNGRLNGLFIVHIRRGRPSSTYLPPLYSIVYAYILCALVSYNTTLEPTYDVDQSYRQGNICHTHTVVRWLGQYIYIYCPVVQLTTTGSWPSGQTQTTDRQPDPYCYCNIVATNQLTHPYKGCME